MKVPIRHVTFGSISMLSIFFLDQWSKFNIRLGYWPQYTTLIEGLFEIYFIQNPGMVLGLRLAPPIAIGISALIIIIVIIFYIIRYIQKTSLPVFVLYCTLLGGALGNIFDRIFLGLIQQRGGFFEGEVVDFLYFSFEMWGWTVFPFIFNIADMAITTSFLILILFYRKNLFFQ